MKKYFTLEEYIDYLASHLKTTMSRDFKEDGQHHIVDLLVHTTTDLEAVFYWMSDYPSE